LAKVASGVVTLQEILAKVGLRNSSELPSLARRPGAQQRDARYFERVIANVDGSGRPGRRVRSTRASRSLVSHVEAGQCELAGAAAARLVRVAVDLAAGERGAVGDDSVGELVADDGVAFRGTA
jgi:hypothetical protein